MHNPLLPTAFPGGCLNPIRENLYAKRYIPALFHVTVRTILWRRNIITRLPPRRAWSRLQYPDYVMFTDASLRELHLKSGLAALVS